MRNLQITTMLIFLVYLCLMSGTNGNELNHQDLMAEMDQIKIMMKTFMQVGYLYLEYKVFHLLFTLGKPQKKSSSLNGQAIKTFPPPHPSLMAVATK